MYAGGSEAGWRRALCKNSNIKGASFFCASGAGWRCQLPPIRGGLVGLRSSEPPEGGPGLLSGISQRTCYNPQKI